MRIFAVLAVLAIASTYACQNQPGSGDRKVSESGYEYVVHTNNEGETPKEGEYIYFHAQMRNADSVVFASRDQGQEPFLQLGATAKEGRPISPVEDVLRNMTVGDSVTIYVDLDTIEQKPRGFENSDVMYYDVVLSQIRSQEEYMEDLKAIQEEAQRKAAEVQARAPEVAKFAQEIATKYSTGALDDELQSTPSGLRYIIHEEGEGPVATPGKQVEVHYYGMLKDGTVFDQSFERGSPIPFPLGVGRVIRGWDEGIGLLNKGAKATLFIPSDLGYGAQGSPPRIPGGAELIFYVELVGIN